MLKFKEGDRVRLSSEASHLLIPRRGKSKEEVEMLRHRIGTVKNKRLYSKTAYVLWDGRKSIEAIHQKFLEFEENALVSSMVPSSAGESHVLRNR